MALADFDALKVLPVSEKITIVQMYPVQLLVSGWVAHDLTGANADVYKQAFPTMNCNDLDSVLRDDTSCTEQASAAALDTATVSYYFDRNGQYLYVNVPDSGDPSDYDYSIFHYWVFSTKASPPIDVEGATAEPNLLTWPNLKMTTKGLLYGVHVPSTGTISFSNESGQFDDYFLNMEWLGSVVKVWYGGEDLAFADYYQFLDGWVEKDPKWKEKTVTFKLTDKRSKLKGDMYHDGLSRDVWPGLDKAWDNKPLPFIYGHVTGVQVIPLTRHYTLSKTIDKTQTYFFVDEDLTAVCPGTAIYQFPAKGRVRIGGERIVYTTINRATGGLGGCTRDFGGSKAAWHGKGALTILYRSDLASTDNGVKYCIANAIDNTEDDAVIYRDSVPLEEGEHDFFDDRGAFQLGVINYTMGSKKDTLIDVTGEMSGVDVIDNYCDVIQDVLDSMLGFSTSTDIDTATFAAEKSKADGKVSIYIGPEDKIEKVLDLMLAGCMGRLYLTEAGKIGIKIWQPVIYESDLPHIQDHHIVPDGLTVLLDNKKTYRSVAALYGRNYEYGDGDADAWQEEVVENPYLDRLYPNIQAMRIKIAEALSTEAGYLAARWSLLTRQAVERISVTLATFEFMDLRPGDSVKISVDRLGISEKRYEIDGIEVLANSFKLTMSDLNGVGEKSGIWTDDDAPSWADSTTEEREKNFFWSDDDGFIVPGDDTTRNVKLWW